MVEQERMRTDTMTFPVNTATEIDLHCPQCGYNLRGIESELCPECGLAVDRAAFAESQLPWSHRRRIGYVRAYLRTLLMGILDSKKLAMEVARPVSFRDAQLFRFITVVIAWIPLASLAVWQRSEVLSTLPSSLTGWPARIPPGLALWWPWVVGALTAGVVPLALAVLLILLSGIASYYFHPKSVAVPLQNRAIALSYYACAPLVALPIAVGLFFLTVVLRDLFNHGRVSFTIATGVGMITAVFPFIGLIGWWLTTFRMHRRIVRAYDGSSVLLALTLPIAWLLCVAFALFGLVWVIGYVILVVRSFS